MDSRGVWPLGMSVVGLDLTSIVPSGPSGVLSVSIGQFVGLFRVQVFEHMQLRCAVQDRSFTSVPRQHVYVTVPLPNV